MVSSAFEFGLREGGVGRCPIGKAYGPSSGTSVQIIEHTHTCNPRLEPIRPRQTGHHSCHAFYAFNPTCLSLVYLFMNLVHVVFYSSCIYYLLGCRMLMPIHHRYPKGVGAFGLGCEALWAHLCLFLSCWLCYNPQHVWGCTWMTINPYLILFTFGPNYVMHLSMELY